MSATCTAIFSVECDVTPITGVLSSTALIKLGGDTSLCQHSWITLIPVVRIRSTCIYTGNASYSELSDQQTVTQSRTLLKRKYFTKWQVHRYTN